MREATRLRLERKLWLEKLKWLGAGLGIVAIAAGMFWYTGLDASVETRQVAGTIETIGPLTGSSTKAIEEGLAVDVRLDDGRHARVMALKTRNPKAGDHVQIAEHVHGTGRVTFTWK
ncbi:MAG: hypothetical protein WC807_13895 [Hyphomicrobium sp.]|jgi:hypothetical protein